MKSNFFILLILSVITLNAQDVVKNYSTLTKNPLLYQRTEFQIEINAAYSNPFDQKDIALDLVLTSPSGKPLALPCFFVSGTSGSSVWNARFAPQEVGKYYFQFRLNYEKGKEFFTKEDSIDVMTFGGNGFLHRNDNWTFKFDSGKLFRAIGENVCWESRAWEDSKFTYDYLLPTLANAGANFFRVWMCPWNVPLEWKTVSSTKRYTNSEEYFNPGGIKRMDELVELCDSLGLHFMLAMDSHGALMSGQWERSNYNKVNGGPASTPTEFFTLESAQNKYKNRLRYMIARWGYSPSIAAWEFFNEIDNSAFNASDTILIPHAAVAQWHDEMSMYIKNTDPYNHLVTTSISHRDIIGMNSLPHIDLNQKHIYKRTEKIPWTIKTYSSLYNKPYAVGEFGYRWEDDDPKYGELWDYDYKRGLWYGLFSPTPVLPMTWWWELFDTRKMTPYFRSVREISDLMLEAGKGSFEMIESSAKNVESYSVKCGKTIFVYLLNNTRHDAKTDVQLKIKPEAGYSVKSFVPVSRVYTKLANTKNTDVITIEKINLKAKEELVLILCAK
ncbi:MAG: DUF5060 domain-containing protein [Melioribacteraceae bacterium]